MLAMMMISHWVPFRRGEPSAAESGEAVIGMGSGVLANRFGRVKI
jgi:hypothetical protein